MTGRIGIEKAHQKGKSHHAVQGNTFRNPGLYRVLSRENQNAPMSFTGQFEGRIAENISQFGLLLTRLLSHHCSCALEYFSNLWLKYDDHGYQDDWA